MFVNPPADVWQELRHGTKSFSEAWLGETPPPPPLPTFGVLPTQKEFAKATYVSALHPRNTWLKEMDKALVTYHAATGVTRPIQVVKFIASGRQYLLDRRGDPDKVSVEVQKFITIAEKVRAQLH